MTTAERADVEEKILLMEKVLGDPLGVMLGDVLSKLLEELDSLKEGLIALNTDVLDLMGDDDDDEDD